MKISLINPPEYPIEKRIPPQRGIWKDPPLGLAYIAAVLQRAQHEVQIIDSVGSQLSWEQLFEELRKSSPDMVGITTVTATLRSALEVARKSKEFHPDVPVVLGGHGAFRIEDAILRKAKEADFIVRGEGEETMLELINAYGNRQSLAKILGLCFRDNNNVIINAPRPFIENLDALPFPARHLLPMKSYVRERFPGVLGKESFRGTVLMSSRGCPFRCAFCASTRFYGTRWRPRSPENVVDEIEHIYQTYGRLGLNGFVFNDDNFMVNPQRVIKICELMIDRRLSNLKWICEGRVDSVDEQLYSAMHKAGCRGVGFGIESGNDQILRKIGKGITKETVRKAVKTAKAVGLKAFGYFMFNLPGDTDETIMDTIRFAEELDLDVRAIHPTFLYPGTEMGGEPEIDWLSFVVDEELDADISSQTGFESFHPCVPTSGDRDRTKSIMKYIKKREALKSARQKGVASFLRQGLAHPKESIKYLLRSERADEKLPQ